MLKTQPICSGSALNVHFLVGDPRCTAREGMLEYIGGRKNPSDAAQDMLEMLHYIAENGLLTPKSYLERMVGRDRVYAVRKARFRMYGFLAQTDLLLCTHDACKRQRIANQKLLDRTEALRDEWDYVQEGRNIR
jgi:hypothetical protein